MAQAGQFRNGDKVRHINYLHKGVGTVVGISSYTEHVSIRWADNTTSSYADTACLKHEPDAPTPRIERPYTFLLSTGRTARSMYPTPKVFELADGTERGQLVAASDLKAAGVTWDAAIETEKIACVEITSRVIGRELKAGRKIEEIRMGLDAASLYVEIRTRIGLEAVIRPGTSLEVRK